MSQGLHQHQGSIKMKCIPTDFPNHLPQKCVAVNWSKKKCFLLKGFDKLQNKKGWTAAKCG